MSSFELVYKECRGVPPMASSASKPRPAHVPEENVYMSMHWLIVATYFSAAVSVFLLITKAG